MSRGVLSGTWEWLDPEAAASLGAFPSSLLKAEADAKKRDRHANASARFQLIVAQHRTGYYTLLVTTRTLRNGISTQTPSKVR